MSQVTAADISSLTREEAEAVAARVLREVAADAFRRHRNVATAAREAAQLVHLAVRLEAFAEEDG